MLMGLIHHGGGEGGGGATPQLQPIDYTVVQYSHIIITALL